MQIGRKKSPDGSEMQVPTWSEGVQGEQNVLAHQPSGEEHLSSLHKKKK